MKLTKAYIEAISSRILTLLTEAYTPRAWPSATVKTHLLITRSHPTHFLISWRVERLVKAVAGLGSFSVTLATYLLPRLEI